MPRLLAQLRKDFLQDVRVVLGQLALAIRQLQRRGVVFNLAELFGDLRDLEYEVHKPRGCGAPGHPIVLGVLFTLREGQAALLLDSFEPLRAVRARPGENDADRVRPLVFSQRAKEEVDHGVRAALLALREVERAGADLQVFIGWDDVDVVRLDPRAVFDLHDGELRVVLQKLG